MDHQTMVAYLDRAGVPASTAGDAAGLRALHRAHQLTVPFENLSIHLAEPRRPWARRPVRVSIASGFRTRSWLRGDVMNGGRGHSW